MSVTTHHPSEPDGDPAGNPLADPVADRAAKAVDAYSRLLGARIRQIRMQKGLSLNGVETRSDEEFKASVLGAYERGERTMAVPRLMRLADHYRVPVDQLLPGCGEGANGVPTPVQQEPVRLNLIKVARMEGFEGELMRRHLGLLQLRRQDFNGRVMSIRQDDERALAAVFGVREERIRAHLFDLGLLEAA